MYPFWRKLATAASPFVLVVATGGLVVTQSVSAGAAARPPLVVAYDADATSLDPAQVTDINTMQMLSQMYQPLVAWSPTKKDQLIGVLATRWTHNAKDTQFTFQLRKGVKFQDGTPFNAAAVVFSFERQLDPANPDYKYGPYPFGSFFFGDVKSVVAHGNYQVVFNLKTSSGGFLSSLTTATAFIVSPSAAMKYGKAFSSHGVGTGPFALANWHRGIQLQLKANPTYWGQKPKSSEIVFIPAVNSDSRVSDLEGSTAQIAVDPTPSSLASLTSTGRYGVVQGIGPHVWWIGLNTQFKPFSNVLVRRAVNYAVNKKAILKGILYGTGTLATQPLTTAQEGYNTAVKGYPYSPTKAKQLLKQAGYPHGFTVNFLVPTSGSGMQEPVSMGVAIQGYLQAVGIKVQLQELDWGTFLDKVNAGAKKSSMDMWELSWMDSAVDPSLVLGPLLAKSSFPPGFNSGFYNDPAFNTLLSEAYGEPNAAKRAALYKKAEALVVADAPWIFVDHANAVYAYSKNVVGFHLNPTFPFLIDLSNVYVK